MFTIMLSLITAFIENVRVITSKSYVSVAADCAIEMIFGNYNKELYEEYGLFAYGGYDGIGISELESELLKVINKNLEYKPEKKLKTYSNLYRLEEISCEAAGMYMLDEDEVLLEQISDYITASTVDNIKETVIKKTGITKSSFKKGMFDETEKYEDGGYDTVNKTDNKTNSEADNKTDNETGGSDSDNTNKDIDEELKSDAAGGNPLEAFKTLINNGLLSLVCDVSKVSEAKTGAGEYNNNQENSDDDSSSASKFFKSLLEGDESQKLEQDKLFDEAQSSSNTGKLKYAYYGENVLSSYIDTEYNTVHYGLEYLIAGKENDKKNLAYVVRRLLIIRTLINMVYVTTNSSFQSKSLATATTIAGFTGIAPLVTGVQWLILAILSFEEACIDTTALLDGKEVPLIKNSASFKMKYEEICAVSHSFFKSKSEAYKKAKGGIISTNISYNQYLMLLELCVPEEKLKNRIIDIIQFDLRERFNQTFEFSDCICAVECRVNYNIPYSYSYIKKNILSKITTQSSDRYIMTSYSYIRDIWN